MPLAAARVGDAGESVAADTAGAVAAAGAAGAAAVVTEARLLRLECMVQE